MLHDLPAHPHPRPVFPGACTHTQWHVPPTHAKVVILNAPRAVTAVWAAVSVFLPARTKAKVQIHGWADPDALRVVVAHELKNGVEVLPTWLGGAGDYGDVLPGAGTVAAALAEMEGEGGGEGGGDG